MWKFPWGGHGNPLQGSCLENPTDRGTTGLKNVRRDWSYSAHVSCWFPQYSDVMQPLPPPWAFLPPRPSRASWSCSLSPLCPAASHSLWNSSPTSSRELGSSKWAAETFRSARSLRSPASVIYGPPAGSGVTHVPLQQFCWKSGPTGLSLPEQSSSRAELLTVRPRFLWLLPGNVARPFAVHFAQSGSKRLPFPGQIKETCCLQGPAPPTPLFSAGRPWPRGRLENLHS